jgi:hypothetical protein
LIYYSSRIFLKYFSSDVSTMDEDDLVSYRQYTTGRGGGKKRPASPTINNFDIDDENTTINAKQRVNFN